MDAAIHVVKEIVCNALLILAEDKPVQVIQHSNANPTIVMDVIHYGELLLERLSLVSIKQQLLLPLIELHLENLIQVVLSHLHLTALLHLTTILHLLTILLTILLNILLKNQHLGIWTSLHCSPHWFLLISDSLPCFLPISDSLPCFLLILD